MNSLSARIVLFEGHWSLEWKGTGNSIVPDGEYCVQPFETFDLAVEKARQLFLGKEDATT